MGETAKRDGWGLVLLVLGLGMLGNGIWMLLDPGHWYQELPAGVPDYGPLNIHFVRDIGCAFITVGIALVWGARRPAFRFPLTVMVTTFLVAHAVLHVSGGRSTSARVPSSSSMPWICAMFGWLRLART